MKKAFETVERKILLRKLISVGIIGNEHDWFRNYFEDRIQRIQFEDHQSRDHSVHTGVAQGSKLGTTLFLIFMDNIKTLELYGQHFLYADDVYTEKSILSLQIHMEVIEKWMGANKLTVNIEKTKAMVIEK